MKIVHLEYPLSEQVLASRPKIGQTMAIGDFDGVHLGHREVIGRAVHAAKQQGIASAVMTFHPHPREVLGSETYASTITPLPLKLDLFREIGLDTVYVVKFNKELASLTPEAFVEEVLLKLDVRSVSVGFNFSFGHKGSGTSQLLRTLGADKFEVHIAEPFLVDGERVSSTLIRAALADGDAERAAQLLGRPFFVTGEVVAGEGRGRTIGVPTANLSIEYRPVKPANGVYAIKAAVLTGPFSGNVYGGVMNVGLKPTFHSDLPAPTWEAHLFDFSGDLYGQRVTVLFLSRIRDERKFDSVAALTEQIRKDISEAKLRIQGHSQSRV